MRLALPLLALAMTLPPETAAISSRSRVDPSAVAAATRYLCPNGGTLVRGLGGSCRGTGWRSIVTAARAGGGVAGWDAGLPAPNRRQAECPEGTYATAAARNAGAVRCVPR